MVDLTELDTRVTRIEQALSTPYFKRNSELKLEVNTLLEANAGQLQVISDVSGVAPTPEKTLPTYYKKENLP